MSAHEAWSLVCRLFAGGTPVLQGTLSAAEIRACAALGPAIKPTVVNRSFALCPYCQLHTGQIFGDGQSGQICQCPDCGPVDIAADDRAALMLDEGWLHSRLRMALSIESRDGVTELGDGVWRLGAARRAPVLLARNVVHLCTNPSVVDRVRVAGTGVKVVAPQSTMVRGTPFASGVEWLPLEERFMFYGGGISYLRPDEGIDQPAIADPRTPVHGPFSADFRWVVLEDWPHGPIGCTASQAKVFEALWSYKATPMHRDRVMERAGLPGNKPIDPFKVKAQNKGKPEHEGPLHAYRALVQSRKREGLYWMPCAQAALV